jgi:predicted tellurium resistance membrane protein TerC
MGRIIFKIYFRLFTIITLLLLIPPVFLLGADVKHFIEEMMDMWNDTDKIYNDIKGEQP